ncbi:alpha/beta hydrolase fold domain-containing protein [Vibrio cholerae]|uniref:alpha/beta hydrolase fold domain-containing protein n=1 Tax=Vibrio cholerae TaxID=666 RepID=UPI001C3115EB
MLRIACVACLDPQKSVHTVTFLRALELFEELMPQVEFRRYDDSADPTVAADVCQEIIDDNVDVVVGHFLSDAAEVAAPEYAKANIPLLLPAATRDGLTRNETTYRVCDSESGYVPWLKEQLNIRGKHIVSVERDASLHAQGLNLALSPQIDVSVQSEGAFSMYVGKYQSCIDYLKAKMEKVGALGSVLLSDDAFSPKLIEELQALEVDLPSSEIWIAALSPIPRGHIAETLLTRYKDRFGGTPGSYFWETIAALEIACDPGFCKHPQEPRDTVLGVLAFDEQREANPDSFALLRCDNDGFTRLTTSSQQATGSLDASFRRLLAARSLLLKGATRSSDDFGRQAVSKWARNYAGNQVCDIHEHIISPTERLYTGQHTQGAPTLIYLHGGGMVYYGLDDFAPLMSRFASDLGVKVVALDYSKLPESTAESSITELMDAIDKHSQGTHASMILGDSIGGLLALYAAVAKFPNRFYYTGLIYPVLALSEEHASYNQFNKGFLLDADSMRWFRSLVRPFFEAENFEPFSLTPTLLGRVGHIAIYSAGQDILRDEAASFARQTMMEEVKVSHHCFEQLPHDFCLYTGKIDAAREAFEHITNDIKLRLKERHDAN